MFAFQLAGLLVACGGESTGAPEPEAANPEPTEAPAPAPDPEPAAKELAPLEVELETNQMTCFGNADCVVVDLDCCCGQKFVASNKSSAEAVTAKFKRPAEECSAVECSTEECAKPEAKCESAKCVLAE